MKVGITYDLEDDWAPYTNAPPDYNGEFDSPGVIDAVEQSLLELGHQVFRIGHVHKLIDFIHTGQSVDIVFNMAEGLWGRGREGQVPAILDAFQIPYTLADSLTMALCLDKAMTKRLLKQANLPTLDFVVATQVGDLEAKADQLPDFPVFVKPAHEGSSKGITSESIIHSRPELYDRVAWIINWYRQPALIEKYLSGPEFTVGILGNGKAARVLGVAKLETPVAGFEEKQDWHPNQFAPISEASPLKEALSQIALKTYHAVECKDTGRIDIRLDDRQQPQILEINPLPGLDPTYSFLPLIAKQAGLTFTQLIGEILQNAIKRWSLTAERQEHK